MGILQSCPTPEEAIASATARSFGSTAVGAVGAADGGYSLYLASMTPFGPIVRSWQDVGRSFVDEVVADTVIANDGSVFFYFADGGDPVRLARAFDGFRANRPVVPSSRKINGVEYSQWWSKTKLGPDQEFKIGQVVSIIPEMADTEVVLRYRNADGLDAGIHAVLSRDLTPDEQAIIARSTGIIDKFIYGKECDEDGKEFDTQVLMLSIPTDLARAFPDGKIRLSDFRA